MARITILEDAILNDQFLDESGYNYYCFMRSDSSWVIMRESVAGNDVRYAIGNKRETTIDKTYSQAVTNRATLSYGYSGRDI